MALQIAAGERRAAGAPAAVRARLATVEDLLDVTLAHVEELNRLRVLLEARVAWMEERVGASSSNSSKPPSSNGPNAPPTPRPGPSGRPKGGQKGHKGHRRELLSPENVDSFVTCKPVACDGCGNALAGEDPELLATFERMWTFVDHEGVPPTSNFAEQQIRHGVIWRKTSFGSASERGCLFAGRILTVVTTCRQLGRDVFAFLVEAVTARLRGLAAPSLVPAELMTSAQTP